MVARSAICAPLFDQRALSRVLCF